MDEGEPDIPHSRALRCAVDRSGSGTVYQVWADNILLWAHPSHIDGPLSSDALRLWQALGGNDA